MQSLLRRHGKENILQRLQNLDTSAIDKERIKQAALQLNTCSSEEIRCLSIGAASFYKWVRRFQIQVSDVGRLVTRVHCCNLFSL